MMENIDGKTFQDLCIRDVTIISGARPAGRTINNLAGRKSHGLLYICSGAACFFEDSDRIVCVNSGELLFIPKGYRYKMQYTAPNTTFVLINLEIFDKNGKDVALSQTLAVLLKNDDANRIAKIMTGLERWGTAQSIPALFRRKELVYKLLGEVYEIGIMPSLGHQEYPQIAAGVLLLEQSYLENLPVSRFSEASNISISSFRTLFGKQYGMSPIQYRNRLRIDRAAALLSEGSYTVSEVAYACGFENIGYFCRCYKKIAGETPLETKLRHC